jgi:phosphatidylglycerol:prolipoprotein diacylglycerol transferase
MHQIALPVAYLILNINPILQLGPLAIHWYGLAYVVGISVGLWTILRYSRRLGLSSEQVFRVFWWAAIGGLVGGRLYFVVQQPDLVSHYLEQPLNIIAVWNGGMAFFGAIFLGLVTVAVVSWRKHLPIWLAFDVAAVFAAVGQIFGRVGNLINGDILGYQAGILATRPTVCTQTPCLGFVADPHIMPWAMVYANPHAFAPLYTPFQPAAAYEMLMNLALLALLLPLRLRLPRIKMGLLSLVYLAGYAMSQIVVFFFRGTEPVTPFLGITIFKQAQWTGIILLLALIPYGVLLLRTSRPWSGWAEPGTSISLPASPTPSASTQAERRPEETRTVLPLIGEETRPTSPE